MKYLIFLLLFCVAWPAERFIQTRLKNPVGGYRWAVTKGDTVLVDSASGTWVALATNTPAWTLLHLNSRMVPENLKMSFSAHLRPKNIGFDSSSITIKVWSKDFLGRQNYPFLRRGGSKDTVFYSPADSGTYSQEVIFGSGDYWLGLEFEPGDSASVMNSGDTVFVDTLGINVQN